MRLLELAGTACSGYRLEFRVVVACHSVVAWEGEGKKNTWRDHTV